MKLRLYAVCLVVFTPHVIAPHLVAQGQLLCGRVEPSNCEGRFRLHGTGIELFGSAIDLAKLAMRGELDLQVNPGASPNESGCALEVLAAEPGRCTFDMGSLRIGASGSWLVSGQPDALALVFVAPTEATSYMPLGNDGTWLLGIDAGLLRAGLVGAQGTFRFGFVAPPWIGVGSSWTAQAIVFEGDAVRVTNPECRRVAAPSKGGANLGNDVPDAVVPDDFPTIQAAVNGAVDLNNNNLIEILVRDGVYDENVDIRRSNLELRGDPNGPRPAIRGTGPDETVEIRGATNVTLVHFLVDSNAGPLGGLGDGLELEHANACTVTDMVFQNCKEGVEIEESSAIELSDCILFRNLGRGLEIEESSAILVANNQIDENGDDGVRVRESRDVTLRDNFIRDNRENGLRIREGEDGFTRVIGNHCLRNGENGARIEDVENLELRQNEFSANGENGLRMREIEDGVVVLNFSLVNNRGFGMRLREVEADFGGTGPPPGNNTIHGNRGDLRIDDDDD